MKRKAAFFPYTLLLALSSLSLSAQTEHPEGDHPDNHRHHLGLGVAATHMVGETGMVPGFHFHYIRQLGLTKVWGIGLGLETIADEHWHNNANLLVNYHPLEFLSFNAGPGIVIGNHGGKTGIRAAFHAECVWEFDIAGIHIGPMAGFGIDREDRHFSAGIHAGFGL